MTEMNLDRKVESRRDGCVRRGELADPRLSYVRWAEERVGASGDAVLTMAAACERFCYAIEAFEDEADALGYGASVASAIVHYFGAHYAGDALVAHIAREARDRGRAGNVTVDEGDGRQAPDEQDPQRSARIALGKALKRDAYEDEEALGEVEANRRKAAAVTRAARDVARHCLDDGQRAALGELLRLGCKLRGSGVGTMRLDVVWLFEAAFGGCSKGYAWIDGAKLDLAGELLDELERRGRVRAGEEAA